MLAAADNAPETDSEEEVPPGWEERLAEDGRVYYLSHVSRQTQWHHPRTGKLKQISLDLPLGWTSHTDQHGKLWFVETASGRATMSDPRRALSVHEQTDLSPRHAEAAVLKQRFDASATGSQVLHGQNMQNRVAIVTGASSGIGYEIARCLARHACTVLLLCRSAEAGRRAVRQISAECATAVDCHVIIVDLASLRSVRDCSVQLLQQVSAVDMLFLNAGVFAPPHTLTEDGLEVQFAVNHVAHFCLARLLLPALTRPGRRSRVVVLSSESHRLSYLTTEEMSLARLSRPVEQYSAMACYNDSKMCNCLFAAEFHRRYGNKGVECFSVHPGNMVNTGLSRHWWLWRVLFTAVALFTKSAHQAAATPLYAATAPQLSQLGGSYLNNCCVCPVGELVREAAAGNKLWLISDTVVRRALGDHVFSAPQNAA